MKQNSTFTSLTAKWQIRVVALFMLLFSANSIQAQCTGTTIAFTWGGGLTYNYAYDGIRNGKCAFKQQTPGTTIEWNGTQWCIYGNNAYLGTIFWHSTVDVGDRPSNNVADWVADMGLAMISFTGTGTIDHPSVSYSAIPDTNFEQALFDLGIDTVNGDHQVITSAISGLTTLDVSNKNISSLVGIQGFTSLSGLTCNGNQLTSLDVSGLTSLQSLNCGSNSLTSLNVSGLTSLHTLSCYLNQLPSLNLSGLTALSVLSCSWNQLPSLNVSGLTALQSLRCDNNLLPSLNVNGLTSLTFLDCGWNQLPSINVSGLTALSELYCNNNQLPSLNVSGLTTLTRLYCENNLLPSINVSGLTALTQLVCYSNQLVSLNVSTNAALTYLECTNNTSLTCITVADVATANANSSWIKDASANYSTNCTGLPTSKVKANQCGSTLAMLDSNINADYVAGYEAYRFEVSNGGTINTVDVNKYNFSLTQTPGITFGTTYGVRVAVKMGGAWGPFGSSCNVSTPSLSSSSVLPTKVHPAVCGTTLAALDTKIPASPIQNATGYRFEIITGGVTTVYNSSTYTFRLADAGIAAYGTTYAIRVAALVNGIYGDYGVSCNVTTPVIVPTTNIIPSLCGTTLATLSSKITAVMVTGATNGRYEITKAGNAPVVYEAASTVIQLAQTGVVVDYNTAYSIRVAAFVGGVWGNYGSSCTVTTPAAPGGKLMAKTFEVVAYPNPFDTAFNLNLETPSKENVTVAVYNMMGKLVESHQVNPLEVANLQLGSNFSTGIYNVIVSQGDNSKAVRLVRK